MNDETDESPVATSGPSSGRDESDETVQVWLVERTYSDDEQNIIILVYATPDGRRYFRKERALTSFNDVRETTAAVDVSPDNLGEVTDEEERDRYATEATRMAEQYDPDESI
ncbi:hypothetical protein [Halosimplex salinum]|uniref:hypothetical protein n=1 Tax=Halosimplex salinum TaxID=1710538 RepID=UPI000F4A007B|nr:hypothetical protein [Halosimplex salinum]